MKIALPIIAGVLSVLVAFLGPTLVKISTEPTSSDTCMIIYKEWSPCSVTGVQTREFIVYPEDCDIKPPLDSIQRACESSIKVTNFYYDVESKSIKLTCNVAGALTVLNAENDSDFTYQYRAGQAIIDINKLPAGKYYAFTYGRSYLFIKQ